MTPASRTGRGRVDGPVGHGRMPPGSGAWGQVQYSSRAWGSRCATASVNQARIVAISAGG